MRFQPGILDDDSELETQRVLDYLFQDTPVCLYWTDTQGKVYQASDGCRALTQGLPLGEFFAQVSADPVNRARNMGCVAEGADTQQAPRLLHWVDPRGRQRWIAHVCRKYRSEKGQGHMGLLVDITEPHAEIPYAQQARSRAYALYQVLEELNRATTMAEVHAIAVEGILKVLQSDRSSLLLFGPDKRPHFVAWRHLSAEYRDQVDGHTPWAMDDLSAQPLWYEDVTQSADFSPELKAVFQREGIRALAFIPLVGSQHLLGKFMVYYNTPHVFTKEERHLAQILANYLTSAISRLRAWQALAKSEARLKGLINATPDVIIFKDERGRWLEANQAALKLFGLEGVDYRGKTDAELAEMVQCRFQNSSLFAECQRLKEGGPTEATLRSEITLHDRRGQQRILDVLRVPVHSQDGTRQGLLIIARDITERKLAEEALRESETRFRALAESTMAAIYVIEGDRFVYVNPALEELAGYTAEELKNMRYWEPVHPDFREIVKQRGRARRRGQPVSPRLELKVRRKDGSERWALVGDVLIRLAGQEVVVGSAVDITDLKQIEEALRHSEARYRALVEHLQDAVGLHDLEGRILSYNSAALAILGLDEVPEIPIFVQELLAPEVRDQFADYIAQIQRDGYAEGLMLIQQPDGEKRLWEYRSTLRKDIQPPVIQFYIRDVTERERTQRALRESEARFRALAESTMAGIYVIVGDRFAYVNQAMEALTGYSEAELMQMEVWKVVHPSFRDLVKRRAQARLTGDAVPTQYEFQILRKDGRVRWVMIGASVIQWDGQPAILASAVDITEHKRYEQALEAEVQLVQWLGEVPEVGMEPLWDQMLEAVQRVVPAADRAALLLLDDQGRLCVRAVRGYQDTSWVGRCFEEAGPAMEAVRRRRAFLIPDVQAAMEIPHTEEVALAQSAVVTPLLVQDSLLGILALDNIHHTHAFDEGDLRILEHFAATATLLLEDARLVKNLQQRLLEMESVHRVARILREASSVNSVLHTLLNETLAAVDSEVGSIMLYDPEEDLLRRAVSTGWFQQLDHPLKPGEGIGGTVFLENRPYFSEDFSQDPLAHPEGRAKIDPGWGGACLPLHTSEDVLGVMFVALPPGRRFTEPQRYLLETLAEIGGITLHRIRLHEETQRRLEQLQVLQAIAQAITGSLDLGLTLKVVVERVRSEFGVDAVDVLLMDQHLLTLTFMSGIGFQTAEATQRQVLVGDGLAGEVALRGRKVIPDLRLGDPPRGKCWHFLQQERFQAYVGVPLMTKGNLKGVLELFHRAPKAFTKAQLEFLEDLARYAAIAIDNAQMFESLQRSAFEVRAAYDATIEGWARALELRDRETEGHAQRVVRLTLALARRLGIPEERLIHVRRGALLHDIGKLGVPDRILHKPGPLTEEERLIMQRHPVLAYEMLKDIEYLQPALIIPLFHHERWDGSGYPRGLKGEQIPLEARIFAVVDVYDALRSDRPYRPAWTKEQALAFIKEQSGKLFDPQVVAAFLSLIEEEEERAA